MPALHARRAWRALIGALLPSLVLLILVAPANADEYHIFNLRYGQQAMGMGGAAAALPNTPEATWYNPAGLARLEGALFSGSVQFYGFDTNTITNAFWTDGLPLPPLESSSFLALPSSSVLARSFFEDRHTVAFSTFLASESDESFIGTFTGADSEAGFDEVLRLSYSRALSDRILYTGPTYALQVGDRLDLGLSAYYVRRDQRTSLSSGFALDRFNGASGEFEHTVFGDITARTEVSDGALVARLGALWRPTGALSLAAVVSSQSIRLHGEGTIEYTFRASGDPLDAQRDVPVVAVLTETADATTVYPWSFTLGAALRPSPALLLSASTTLRLPVEYERLDLTPDGRSLVASHFVNAVEHTLEIDGALGVEYIIAERWPLRAGLFTNRSSAPGIDAAPRRPVAPSVDLYGATLSLGYLGDRSSINAGIEAQLGQGADAFPRDALDVWSPSLREVDREQVRVVFFLSGALDFAKATAMDLLEMNQEEAPAPTPEPSSPEAPTPAPTSTPPSP